MKRRQFITALSVAQPNAIGVIVGVICSINTSYPAVR